MSDSTALLSLLAAVLLAAPCGLNPYLPPLFLAAMLRSGGAIRVGSGMDFLGQTWFLALAAALFLVNVFLDKVFRPGDSLATPRGRGRRWHWLGKAHDVGQMILGPLAGGLLMVAVCRAFSADLFLIAPMVGLLLAALVYAGKRALRYRFSGRLGPLSNILFSVLEDVVVALFCVVALLLLR